MQLGLFTGVPEVDEASIQARFEAFDRENPRVWELFVQFAEQVLNAGRKRYSADAIGHRVRWHTQIETRSDDGFKLNDHYISRYARKLAQSDERFKDFFEFRKIKSA